jgi:hypothetical protein
MRGLSVIIEPSSAEYEIRVVYLKGRALFAEKKGEEQRPLSCLAPLPVSETTARSRLAYQSRLREIVSRQARCAIPSISAI